MNPVRSRLAGAALLARYLDWEALVTERCNRIQDVMPLRRSFSWASRLGDGVGWYLLAAVMLVLHGREAWLPMGVMLASGGLGVAIYLAIKRRTARLRPVHRNERIRVSVAPLDQYSFPSGHTLHAVNFGIQLIAFEPGIAWVVIPFALLVAASRMVLGLHYLSDVLAGGGIGAVIAVACLSLL